MSSKVLASAAAAGDLAAVKRALANDPEAASHWKPLMDASFGGHPKVVRELLRRGADVNVVAGNPSRHRPIHRVAEHKKTIPKGPGHLAVVKLLCESGADLELTGGNYRWRALAIAANGGEKAFVDVMLANGAKRDLFSSASLLDVARVRRALAKDASAARSRDAQGRSALHYLCASGMNEVVPKGSEKARTIAGLLLDAGADVDASWQAEEGEPRRPQAPLYWAVGFRKHAGLVAYLLERGGNAAAQIHNASINSTPEILELLLSHGASVDHKHDGLTPLHWLLGHGLPEHTGWFLEHGANVNARTREGLTPLHYAASAGVRREILELLLEHGAQLSLEDKAGHTPLAAAKRAKKKGAVAWLREQGGK